MIPQEYSFCPKVLILLTWLVSAFTLVGLNRLPPEQVHHLKPSKPTFADPEPGHKKWQVNRDSITEDQLLGDLIMLVILDYAGPRLQLPTDTFSPVWKRRGEKYIADELSLLASICVLGKCMKPVIPHLAMSSIVSLLFFYKDGFGIK